MYCINSRIIDPIPNGFMYKAKWDWVGFVIDRAHDVLPAAYIASALLAPPKYITLHPLVVIILGLNWNDPSGMCYLTKLSQYLSHKYIPEDHEPWNYTKESVQNSGQWTNPLYVFFGGQPKDLRESTIQANKASFLSYLVICAFGFIAWYRVTIHYKIPNIFNSKARFFILIYFISWLAVTLLL